MADEIMLNNYSDDSQIKNYMRYVLAPKVFHDIPLTVLNTGLYSLTTEYISQITEQLSFTSSFYFNESFITKAVLPDSIYAEAAIFNIGYSFATPASTNFLLELKIEDIYKNALYNADTGLYEFILDKNTKFNLPEGFTYSLDYDILIQYKDEESSRTSAAIPAWNIQYTNMDEPNVCATNKNVYITYRVTDVWLCLLIQANEYERQTYTVTNTMTNGVPNEDKVIMCQDHIAGFDVVYIDGKGNRKPLPRNHILPIHDKVPDADPYVHYIMDNPRTIRFMWQLNGVRYFIPEPNSSFEITIYTCHGKSANAPSYQAQDERQPSVISASNKYTNNANVTKAAFVISGCVGGTDIGSVEPVRRETIEAYNTANVLSTDHDIDEWFKTFYFKNVLYPYFFKRRDDPWCRTWSGYLALTRNDNYIYKTNTLHANISYEELYNNANNTVTNNEIIIPPGWIWVYTDDTRYERDMYTVVPYTKADGKTIESVNTLATIKSDFIFANPFGIRIQIEPFAIGYFNPWINQFVTGTKLVRNVTIDPDDVRNDPSSVYHASHIISNIVRTYKDDHYLLSTHILPTIPDNSAVGKSITFAKNLRINAIPPQFTPDMWKYFANVQDPYGESIPITILTEDISRIEFDPEKTYFCVQKKVQGPSTNTLDNTSTTDHRLLPDDWALEKIWIEDNTGSGSKIVDLPITTNGSSQLFGSNAIWGENGKAEGVEATTDVNISIVPSLTTDSLISFERVESQNYYEMRLKESAVRGAITKIVVSEATPTDLHKYGENYLVKIGRSYQSTAFINVYYDTEGPGGTAIKNQISYGITNAANIYMPYACTAVAGGYEFDMNNVGPTGIILYADMKPSPSTGSYAYYRVKFSDLDAKTPMFYIYSTQLKMNENEMRVIAHTMINGSETGRIEMQPVKRESDGSYLYEASMYPLNELIDIDNRINIASIINGGGSWRPASEFSDVSLDATNPQIKITVLMKSAFKDRPSEIVVGDDFTGYRIVDEYMLDNLDLIQELKEMRSVVEFGDTTAPTADQMKLYQDMMALSKENPKEPFNIYYMTEYAFDRKTGIKEFDPAEFQTFIGAASVNAEKLRALFERYDACMNDGVKYKFPRPEWFASILTMLDNIAAATKDFSDDEWTDIYMILNSYPTNVNITFGESTVNVHGGITIHLVPFVEYSLMEDDKFVDFVSSFTQVHKAIEPVIFKRLDGNHYLDCKLIGTYGKSRTYVCDTDREHFWPDLNLQMEFDVKLFNKSLATNTIDELRLMVKSYFNRITTVHSPNRDTNMDNNIYVSHLIQQMEAHDNVAWMKFKGWYTNQKGKTNSNYKDANTQAIELKWNQLEDMDKYILLPDDPDNPLNYKYSRLENYTPEMFILEDNNIKINIV